MGKDVLIVEHNLIFRRFLESALPQNYPAYRFIFAESADCARKELAKLTDLYCLITNYNVGENQLDGIEFAQEIKDKFPKAKVILISQFIDDTLRAKASQAGIYYCASKFDGLYQWIKFMEG